MLVQPIIQKLLESFPESKTWYLNFHWKDISVELCCTFVTDLSESVVSMNKTASTILLTLQLYVRNSHLILDKKLYANKKYWGAIAILYTYKVNLWKKNGIT